MSRPAPIPESLRDAGRAAANAVGTLAGEVGRHVGGTLHGLLREGLRIAGMARGPQPAAAPTLEEPVTVISALRLEDETLDGSDIVVHHDRPRVVTVPRPARGERAAWQQAPRAVDRPTRRSTSSLRDSVPVQRRSRTNPRRGTPPTA